MLRTVPCHSYHIQIAIIGAGELSFSDQIKIVNVQLHLLLIHLFLLSPRPLPGVVGLSVARALSQKGHEVLVLEQSNAIGSGISSRNSEVIHAGIYYDKFTMPFKSRFCVEGKKLLYDFCRDRDIPHRSCGKLLVATDAEQRDVGLPQLVEYAKRNGVHDLQIVSKEDIADPYSKFYESNVLCTGGVFSPSTGIVDSHSFMTGLLADAEDSGTTLALHCRVEEISCDNVVICAGLLADKIASSILSSCATKENNISDNESGTLSYSEESSQIPKQYYAKGNYFKLENQKAPFTRLIYPLPDPKGGLGVHATIDLSGATKFGPDVEWIGTSTNNPDDIDMNVDPTRAESFYAAVRKYWPELQEGNLVPDYVGVRPKLLHPDVGNFDGSGNNRLRDFMIAGPEYHGVKGLTVLLGIESPG
ncbi:hypothetical protein ACHAXR_005207 [Thalassiosira sp. AJA248-18]